SGHRLSRKRTRSSTGPRLVKEKRASLRSPPSFRPTWLSRVHDPFLSQVRSRCRAAPRGPGDRACPCAKQGLCHVDRGRETARQSAGTRRISREGGEGSFQGVQGFPFEPTGRARRRGARVSRGGRDVRTRRVAESTVGISSSGSRI